MQKKTILLNLLLTVLSLLFVNGAFGAIAVGSYDELYKVLPGGVEHVAYNKSVIEKAQKQVTERKKQRKKRKIKFVKPIEFLSLNEKYFSVAFDVVVVPRKKTVFALLFEKAGADRIAYNKNIYLSWIGARDIKIFKGLTIDDLVKNYRNMGVTDCHSDYVRPKVEKIFSAKADVGHIHKFSDIEGILQFSDIEGILPESKIDNSIARDAELKVKIDSYVGTLENRITELESTINELKTTFKGVQRKGGSLVFNNMNVQITNGKGATEAINGRGNLIVGYNESRGKDSRKGSHNIVVGRKNNYTSFGGIVSGYNNSISGKYAIVGGGHNNYASGEYSAITGGGKNSAKGKYTSISGQVGRTKVDPIKNKHFKSKASQ